MTQVVIPPRWAGREILVPDGEAQITIPTASARRNLVLGFDADGAPVATAGGGGGSSSIPELPEADFDQVTDVSSLILDSISTYNGFRLPKIDPANFGIVGTQIVMPNGCIADGNNFGCALKMKNAFGTSPMIVNAVTNPADEAHMDSVSLLGLRLLGNSAHQTGNAGSGDCIMVALLATKNSIFDLLVDDCFSDALYIGVATGSPSRVPINPRGRVRGTTYQGRNTVTVIGVQGGYVDVIGDGYALNVLDIEANVSQNVTLGFRAKVLGRNGGSSSSHVCAVGGGNAVCSDVEVDVSCEGTITGGLLFYRNCLRFSANVQGTGFSAHGVEGGNGGIIASTGTITGSVAPSGGQGYTARDAAGRMNTADFQVVTSAASEGFYIEAGGQSTHDGLSVTYSGSGNPQAAIRLYGCSNVTMTAPYAEGGYKNFSIEEGASPSTGCRILYPISKNPVSRAIVESGASTNNEIVELDAQGTVKGVDLATGSTTTCTVKPLKYTGAWTPGAVAPGTPVSTTVTLTGIVNAANYVFSASFGVGFGLRGAVLDVWASADNAVTAQLSMPTGDATVTFGAGTLIIYAYRQY